MSVFFFLSGLSRELDTVRARVHVQRVHRRGWRVTVARHHTGHIRQVVHALDVGDFHLVESTNTPQAARRLEDRALLALLCEQRRFGLAFAREQRVS